MVEEEILVEEEVVDGRGRGKGGPEGPGVLAVSQTGPQVGCLPRDCCGSGEGEPATAEPAAGGGGVPLVKPTAPAPVNENADAKQDANAEDEPLTNLLLKFDKKFARLLPMSGSSRTAQYFPIPLKDEECLPHAVGLYNFSPKQLEIIETQAKQLLEAGFDQEK